MFRIASCLLPLFLAACGSENASRLAQNAEVSAAPAGERVAALPDAQREAVFIRAIRDAGQDCQHVESSRPGGTYRGMPVWQAVCSGGGDWTIVIADDGSAQLLNSDQAKLVTD